MGQKSRINKFIALSGLCSRRAAEKLIEDGRVLVNGEILSDLGRIIDHDLDSVEVNGASLTPAAEKEYLLLNKPPLVLTTLSDPHGRPTVMKFLACVEESEKAPGRVCPVGRLDFDTEGALLFTNDGELAHRLTHPKYQVEKVYHAVVDGAFRAAHAKKIESGVELEDGHRGRANARSLGREGASTIVELVLREGHKREVKQLLAACGLKTQHLRRVAFAGLETGDLRPGGWRRLTREEVTALRKLVGM